MPRPAAAHEVGADYEALRSWALERPRPRCAPAGAMVLLRQGLAAWLQAGPRCGGQWPHESPAPPAPSTPHLPVDARDQALVRILATMVAYAQ